MLVFTPSKIACATTILVGEYFICGDDGVTAYHWLFKDNLVELSSFFLDGTGFIDMVQITESTPVLYQSVEGIPVSLNLLTNVSSEPIELLNTDTWNCCPCDWQDLYYPDWTLICGGGGVSFYDNIHSDLGDVTMYAHEPSASLQESGLEITQLGQYYDALQSGQVISLVKFNPTNRCFAISPSHVPESLSPF
jgi:hypothetical protein